jgi:hypothetical protein
LKKLIKKLGREFGPWSTIAILMIENMPLICSIGRRAGSYFGTVFAWVAQMPLVLQLRRLTWMSYKRTNKLLKRSSRAVLSTLERWQTVFTVCAALYLEYACGFFVAAVSAVLQGTASLAVLKAFLPTLLIWRTPRSYGGISVIAWAMACLARLAFHLKLSEYVRSWHSRRCSQTADEDPVEGEEVPLAAELLLSSGRVRVRRRRRRSLQHICTHQRERFVRVSPLSEGVMGGVCRCRCWQRVCHYFKGTVLTRRRLARLTYHKGCRHFTRNVSTWSTSPAE